MLRQHPRSRDIPILVEGLSEPLEIYKYEYNPRKDGDRFGVSLPVDGWRNVLWAACRLKWDRKSALHPAVRELVDAFMDLGIDGEDGVGFEWDDPGPCLIVESEGAAWERLHQAWLRVRKPES